MLSEGELNLAFAAATTRRRFCPHHRRGGCDYLDGLDDADGDIDAVYQANLSAGAKGQLKVTADSWFTGSVSRPRSACWSAGTTASIFVNLSSLKIQVKGVAASSPPKITISPAQPRVLGKLDTAFWNLTREGDTANALTVTVTLTPAAGNDWAIPSDKLSHDVTFSAGSSTAVLDNRLIATNFKNIGFSNDATTGGTLTAGLGTVTGYDTTDTAAVEVVIVTHPAWVVKLADPAPRFSEAGGAQRFAVEAYATSAEVPPPTVRFTGGTGSLSNIGVKVASDALNSSAAAEADKAHNQLDLIALSKSLDIPPSSFSAGADGLLRGRASITLTTRQDTLTEGDETFTLGLTYRDGDIGANSQALQLENPDGTLNGHPDAGAEYPAVIEDDEITIESVAVTSTPKAKPDTYGLRELIEFTVTFSDPVTVTGDVTFWFMLGDANKSAEWRSAYNEQTSATHVFRYIVSTQSFAGTLTDTDGITLLGNEDFADRTGPILLISSATIDDPGGVADTVVDLTWAGRGIESGHKVDNALAPPGAPGNLTAVAGDAQVSLGWTGAAANGFDILRYEYRYKSGTGDYPAVWTELPDGPDAGSDPTDETFVTLTGLTNGDAHTFQLRAVNRLGDGTSAESAAVTPAATACPAPVYTGGAREVLSAIMTAGTGDYLTFSATGFSSIDNTSVDTFGQPQRHGVHRRLELHGPLRRRRAFAVEPVRVRDHGRDLHGGTPQTHRPRLRRRLPPERRR